MLLFQSNAMKTLEKDVTQDGQYSFDLVKASEVPYGSDLKDNNICPYESLTKLLTKYLIGYRSLV